MMMISTVDSIITPAIPKSDNYNHNKGYVMLWVSHTLAPIVYYLVVLVYTML